MNQIYNGVLCVFVIQMLLLAIFGIFALCKSNEGNQIILSTVLFRHGARAPSGTISSDRLQYFPTGNGQLTKEGLRHSYQLGQFLAHRYIGTGFLKTPFDPAQVFFRSLAIDRCLMTAAAVGSGIYADEPTFVPIYSQINGENMLDYDFVGCTLERERLQSLCGNVPTFDNFPSWPEFEGFNYECMGLNQGSIRFPNASSFEDIETAIVEEQNGIPLPVELQPYSAEMHDVYYKVFRFVVGSGVYHDEQILRMKGGLLINQIIQDIQDKIKCEKSCECNNLMKKRRLMVYSTQDWIIMIILEMFGVLDEAVGSAFPNFNAAIIIEVYNDNGEIGIRFLYKRDPVDTNGLDLTTVIPGCLKSPCSLDTVVNVIQKYATNDPKKACTDPYIPANSTLITL